MKHKFGTNENPSGMLSVFGKRPGFAASYDEPMQGDARLSMVTYTTTREAIKEVLPSPLEPVLDLPPMVAAVLCDASNTYLAWDGKNHPYWELGLWFPCQYKGVVGMHLFHLYLDGPGAPQGCICGRETFGTSKTIANIEFVYQGDEAWASVMQEAIPRITIHTKCSKDVPPDQSPMNMCKQTIFLKEIPNCDFTGYDVRKVICTDWGQAFTAKSFFKIGEGSVQLGPPFDVLKIVEMGPAYMLDYDASQSNILVGVRELADLLKK